jgi:hypothetical protein
MIIGFSGYARSGKDTAASALPGGFRRRAFADKLKEAARVIFGLNDIQLYGALKEKPDAYWNKTPREIMQLLGTECLRKGFADDVWIRALFLCISDYDIAITDVRFPNEAKAIKERGGIVVRVVRPGVGPTPRPWWKFWAPKPHASETALDDWSFDDVLINDGTLEDLERKVKARVRAWQELCVKSSRAAHGGGLSWP